MTTREKKTEYSLESYEDELDFGAFLKSIRKSDGFTQETLAKKMRCSKQYISGIENGNDSVTIEVAKKLADALGYSPAAFVEILFNSQLKKADLKLRVTIKKSA